MSYKALQSDPARFLWIANCLPKIKDVQNFQQAEEDHTAQDGEEPTATGIGMQARLSIGVE